MNKIIFFKMMQVGICYSLLPHVNTYLAACEFFTVFFIVLVTVVNLSY